MDILVTAPYVPYPLHGGASVRMFNLLRGVAHRGHDIHLISGAKQGADPEGTPLGDICTSIETYRIQESTPLRWVRGALSPRPYPAHRFATQGYKEALARFLEENEPDLVWANFLFMADPAADLAPDEIPVVLDQHEAEVHHWRGYLADGTIHERVFAGITLAKLRRFEPSVLAGLDAAIAVAEPEAEHLRARTPHDVPVWVLPNGADVSQRNPLGTPPGDGDIVFVGGMGVQRNAEAAIWFAKEIFPKIQSERPGARFRIVGSDPLPKVEELQEELGVEVTGTVPDVEPYYRDASVVVVPQRHGAGTKLKVLEALALQRPLISTPNGVQGIHIEDGRHALIREDPQEFASAVLSVLRDPSAGFKLAEEGRRLVEGRYAWSAIVDDLDRHLRRLVQG